MLHAAQSRDLATELRQDIADNHIQLPTLPEVALKVRDALESEDADAHRIAEIVTGDAALSARLVQVANSPLYRGRVAIDNVQMAITRMGIQLVKNLVISLAMKQIFQASSDALDREFRSVWDHSLQIAAISRVLAGNVPELENEQAMLGGLIHNIGALPILTKIDEKCGFQANAAMIDELIEELSPEIGAHILQHWNFADSLANIPTACYDLAYDPGPFPTYADIVLVARLKDRAAQQESDSDWSHVPAFNKIGIEPEVIVVDMEGPAPEIAEVRTMLDG